MGAARWAWAVGAVGVSCVVGFAARAWLMGGVDATGQALAIGAAGLLLSYAWLDREQLEDASQQRAVRHAGASVTLVVGAGFVAVLAYAAVRAFDTTVDLTRRQEQALTSHTLGVLDALPRPVEVVAFFPHGSMLQRQTERLLRRYDERSDLVSTAWLDPLRDPLRARELEVTFEAGEIVLLSGDKQEHLVGRFDEDALTDALVRVTSDREHIVCWSEGHGEADPDDTSSAGGMGAVVLALEGQNYQVMRANLLAGGIPETCDVLVVARPTVDMLAFEVQALHAWVLGGGQALVLLEPGVTPVLASALSAFGLTVGDDLVLDPDPAHQPLGVDDPSFLLIPPGDIGPHPITRGLSGPVLLGLARSVAAVDGAPGMATRSLLNAGAQSWAEQQIGAPPDRMAPDDGELQGYVAVAAIAEVMQPEAVPSWSGGDLTRAVSEGEIVLHLSAVLQRALATGIDLAPDTRLGTDLGLSPEAVTEVVRAVGMTLGVDVGTEPDPRVSDLVARLRAAVLARLPGGTMPPPPTPVPGGRLVVVGDASFAGNRNLAFGANRDLFLDSIAWLAREDAQLGARPDNTGDVLAITARDQMLLMMAALLLMPAVPLALGWRARRRRQRG